MPRFVKYIGPSHIRQITAAEWRSVGIQGDTVQWNAFNGFAVPADQFSDEQIRKAIDPDQYFVITGEEDAPQPVLNPSATPQSLAAGDFDITDDADRDRAQDTVTEDGQAPDVDDKAPASTTGGAPTEQGSR